MNKIPFRRQMQIAAIATDIVGDFNKLWKFGRLYPKWLSKTYSRVVKLAESRNIIVPKTEINMEVEIK